MAASFPRRQVVLLGGLLVLLAAVVGYQFWWSAAPGTGGPSSPQRTSPARAPAGTAAQAEVPDVHIEALNQAKPEPAQGGRNLFLDRPAPPPQTAAPRAAAVAPPQARPTGPPPPPPIDLKFIGLVEAGGRSVAVLTDGRDVLYGREGEVVDGRYLIVKINVETIEVSYPDGSGRRVIRLTG